jgi:hypothetical protein
VKIFAFILIVGGLNACAPDSKSLTEPEAFEQRMAAQAEHLFWKPCTEASNEFCFHLDLSLRLIDRVERNWIGHQTWDYQFYDVDGVLLAQGTSRIHSSGSLILKPRILILQDRRFSKMPILLRIQNEFYGAYEYSFEIDFFDFQNQSESFEIKDPGSLKPKILPSERNFRLDILDQKIRDVSHVSKHEERVLFDIRARLIDEQSGQGLSLIKIQIKIDDSTTNRTFTDAAITNKSGEFDFHFSLTRFRFFHESQKKIKIEIFIQSEIFKNQFEEHWIIDLEPDSDHFVRARHHPDEFLQNDFWRDRSRNYASEVSPQIFLNKLAIVESPSQEKWQLSDQLRLIHSEKLVFEFALSLERVGFEGRRFRNLSGQKINLRLGQADTSLEDLTPFDWREIQEFEIVETPSNDYSVTYSKEVVLGPEIQTIQPWFLMETFLEEFPIIAPSYHLIRWPKLYFKNLRNIRLIQPMSARRTETPRRFNSFETLWNADSLAQNSKLSPWLESLEPLKGLMSSKDATEILEWLRKQALASGQAVGTRLPWQMLQSFRVNHIIHQELSSKDELGLEQKRLEFEIKVQGRPCLSFACHEQILSVCSQKVFEMDSKIGFFVENLMENLAHRQLDPDASRLEKQPPWMLDGFLFFPLISNLRLR